MTAWVGSLLAAAAIQGTGTPQDASGERFKALLAATGLKFDTTASGLSYQLRFTRDGQADRTVFVSIAPSTIGTFRFHAIYTIVWTGKAPPSAALVDKAFTATKKLGTFYLYKESEQSWSIRFGTHVDSSAIPAFSGTSDPSVGWLKETIQFVDQAGFEAANEWSGQS